MTPTCHVSVLIVISWLKGVHLNMDQQVLQTPKDLIVEPNQEVQLSFTHKIKEYNAILWYQRSPGDSALKLIGYMYNIYPTLEPAFDGRFQLKGDGKKSVSLIILNPRHPEDDGEYFGAARYHSDEDWHSARYHSDEDWHSARQKSSHSQKQETTETM